MKLVYWIADNLTDHASYSIRAQTRKEASTKRTELGAEGYAPPRKVTITYTSAFDLMQQLLSEGGAES